MSSHSSNGEFEKKSIQPKHSEQLIQNRTNQQQAQKDQSQNQEQIEAEITHLRDKLDGDSPFKDVEFLAMIFSEIYHCECPTPDYYINGFSKNRSEWDVIELDDPAKTIREFLPHCRLPERMKRNIYYKAERSNQSEPICQLFANYLWKHTNSGNIYYRGKKITSQFIQFLTVKGYQPIIIPDWGKSLLPMKQLTFPIIGLNLDDNSTAYIDLCSPQIDLNHYGENDQPYFTFTELPAVGKPLDPTCQSVTIVEIGKIIQVKNQKPLEEFYQNINTSISSMNDEEELSKYYEYCLKQYADFLKVRNTSYTRSIRNKIKKLKKRLSTPPSASTNPESSDNI